MCEYRKDIDKPCEYCAGLDKPWSEYCCDDKVLYSCTYIIVGEGIEHSVPLNYCPNCGRKLIEEENK